MYGVAFLLCSVIVGCLTATSNNVLPLCTVCDCENDAENNIQVTCDSADKKPDLSHLIFDKSKWLDANNRTYNYQQLKIVNCQLVNLDKAFFKSTLKTLQISNCSLANITDNVFHNLQEMEVLVLSYNQLSLLDPNAFQGDYQEGDFNPLRALKILRLDHNRIHSLDGDIFEHTSRLETLNLAHNPLKFIDQQTLTAITSLPYLKHLDLSFTDLATLPDHFLHTPIHLETLDLSGNQFHDIPPGLGDSHNLVTFYFNSNPVENLTAETGFPLIPTLKQLHMRNMFNLHSIHKGALCNLENLEELYLYDNPKLSHLDRSALSSRKNDAEYETWPPLKKLFLQNNKLTSLDLHFYPRWDNLVELHLVDNPLTCECENQWLIDELMPIYMKLDADEAKSLICAAPVEMESLTFFDLMERHDSLRCLDFYGNRPEKDGVLLVGALAGVLITIPIVLFLILAYQRRWFGFCEAGPAAFSRRFYNRTNSTDEYM